MQALRKSFSFCVTTSFWRICRESYKIAPIKYYVLFYTFVCRKNKWGNVQWIFMNFDIGEFN
jgi:hypothetical protein